MSDLTRGDFRLLDDGRPQELITFERGDIPFTAAILVDDSGSMEGLRLSASPAGAHRFVSGMRPFDEAKTDGVLRAPARDHPVERLGGADRPRSRHRRRRRRPALFDHLYMALTLFEARQVRCVVILLSDG